VNIEDNRIEIELKKNRKAKSGWINVTHKIKSTSNTSKNIKNK